MKIQYRALLVGGLLVASGAASAAGSVEVSFVDSASYTDAGNSRWEKDANLKLLQNFLQEAGTRHLANGERLRIEILDLDLAGTVEAWRRTGTDVRIVRGGADSPRISLRYTLQVDGKTVRSATEQLADLNYMRAAVDARSPKSLQYEKNLLESWFKNSFVEARAAG